MATREQRAKKEEQEKIAFELQLGLWLVFLLNKMVKAIRAEWNKTQEELDLQIFQEDMKAVLSRSYEVIARKVMKDQMNNFNFHEDQEELEKVVVNGSNKQTIINNSNFILNTLQKLLTTSITTISNFNSAIRSFKKEATTHLKSTVSNTQVQTSYESSKFITAAFILVRKGFSASAQKIWIAVLDDRTRPWHREAHGQTVGFNDKFIVGPDQMRYPGDQSASIANTAGCRCSLFFI